MKKSFYIAACFLAALSIQSCNNKNGNATTEDTLAQENITAEEVTPTGNSEFTYDADFFTNPEKKGNGADSTYVETESGLRYAVIKEGTGASPKETDNVTVHYTGMLVNGEVFDGSRLHGTEPISFPLNGVIKGWTEGLQTMKEGGVTEFYIPADLAYGDRVDPNGPIPPNAPLIFRVELIKVN